MKSELVEKAKEWATKAHANQRSKGSGEPYIEHPEGVVAILERWGVTDPAVLAAAWLHDVPEDTPEPFKTLKERDRRVGDLSAEFGERVASLVEQVTEVAILEEVGRRRLRAIMNREHLEEASQDAQDIKCADILHNVQNIVKVSPHFAPVYLPEKMAELLAMNRATTSRRTEVLAVVSGWMLLTI